MERYKWILSLYFLTILHKVRAPMPGTFFWRPRLGLDLNIPTTESSVKVHKPNLANIKLGVVVLVDGYQAGMMFITLASSIASSNVVLTLNPLAANFYTNAWRWALRHLSLLPYWMGGAGGHYCGTHKVWKRRYYYMDEFVPQWLRPIFPWVAKDSWAKEELDFRRFKTYSEPAFGKHFRYPTKRFREFISQITIETAEGVGLSAVSISGETD